MELYGIEARIHVDDDEHDFFVGRSEEEVKFYLAEYLRTWAIDTFEEVLPEDDEAAIKRYEELDGDFWYGMRYLTLRDDQLNQETMVAIDALKNSPGWFLTLTQMSKEKNIPDMAAELKAFMGKPPIIPLISMQDDTINRQIRQNLINAAVNNINWEAVAAAFSEGIENSVVNQS